MKKSHREIYIILTKEVDNILCAFCKYSECQIGISPCDCGESYCVHPLKDHLPHDDNYGLEPGNDCWGFRPVFSVELCADIVGILLQKGWDDWVVWKSKKGNWRIHGTTSLSLKGKSR